MGISGPHCGNRGSYGCILGMFIGVFMDVQ